MDQERSKIGVPALTDPEDSGLAAGGGLLWYQAQPGGQLPTIGETFDVANRGEQCRGDEWADTGKPGPVGETKGLPGGPPQCAG